VGIQLHAESQDVSTTTGWDQAYLETPDGVRDARCSERTRRTPAFAQLKGHLLSGGRDILVGNIGFWVGREFGTSLLSRWGYLIGLDERKRKLGQYLFARHGGKIEHRDPAGLATLRRAESEGLHWNVDIRKPKSKHLPKPESRRTLYARVTTAAIDDQLVLGRRLHGKVGRPTTWTWLSQRMERGGDLVCGVNPPAARRT
jgi:hypothetical protein